MHQIESLFIAKFNRSPAICVQAPTRINIIGEHTDYNGGIVLPAAINHYIYFGITKSTTAIAFIFDENKQEQFAFDLDEDLAQGSLSQWRKYFYGAIKILQEEHTIGGFQLMKYGQAPIGAGISSSAALCCGFIYALNELFELGIDKWTMAHLARRVEQEYVGLNCGIMDQFAVLFGEQNMVLALNCSNLDYTKQAINLGDYELLLCNSKVKHNLADSAYNERVVETQKIKEVLGITSMLAINEEAVMNMSNEKLQSRARHFVSENHRVHEMIKAFKNEKFKQVGQLLSASHLSLKEDYAVTCEETDTLVNLLLINGAMGSRQMGGGFGGCVLALIPKQLKDQIKQSVAQSYDEKFNVRVDFIDFEITDGVKKI